MLNVIKINSLDNVQNDILRDRAGLAHGGRSQEFIAIFDGIESGLLSYEDWSDKSLGFIYEIFILPAFRNQGIGSALLLFAEDIATKFGCTTVQLKAHALSHEIDKNWLTSWYSEKGYFQKSDDAELMEKKLPAPKA